MSSLGRGTFLGGFAIVGFLVLLFGGIWFFTPTPHRETTMKLPYAKAGSRLIWVNWDLCSRLGMREVLCALILLGGGWGCQGLFCRPAGAVLSLWRTGAVDPEQQSCFEVSVAAGGKVAAALAYPAEWSAATGSRAAGRFAVEIVRGRDFGSLIAPCGWTRPW